MNIDVKYWSYKKLGGIFDKDILIQVLFKYLYYFKIYRKISTKRIKFRYC